MQDNIGNKLDILLSNAIDQAIETLELDKVGQYMFPKFHELWARGMISNQEYVNGMLMLLNGEPEDRVIDYTEKVIDIMDLYFGVPECEEEESYADPENGPCADDLN